MKLLPSHLLCEKEGYFLPPQCVGRGMPRALAGINSTGGYFGARPTAWVPCHPAVADARKRRLPSEAVTGPGGPVLSDGERCRPERRRGCHSSAAYRAADSAAGDGGGSSAHAAGDSGGVGCEKLHCEQTSLAQSALRDLARRQGAVTRSVVSGSRGRGLGRGRS
jgi:hypothetical protein